MAAATGSRKGMRYVGRPGRDAIYTRGLRSPFRFSIDRNRIPII